MFGITLGYLYPMLTQQTLKPRKTYFVDSLDLAMGVAAFTIYQLTLMFSAGQRTGVDGASSGVNDALKWLARQISSPHHQAIHLSIYFFVHLAVFFGAVWAIRKVSYGKDGRSASLRMLLALIFSLLGIFLAKSIGVLVYLQIGSTFEPSRLYGEFIRLGIFFGTGFHEELVFRVLGTWVPILILRRMFDISRFQIIGIWMFSSLVFTVFHQDASIISTLIREGIGPIHTAFLTRFVLGFALCALHRYYGFGVAVLTHIFYDIMV